jgi:outer membrane protein TolC
MIGVGLRSLPRLPGLARLAAGLPLLSLACAALPAAGQAPPAPRESEHQSVQVLAAEPGPAPPPAPVVAPAAEAGKPVPVSLDAVLRLAQDQNAQIGVARERVREAFADKAVAAKSWLPELYLGTTYYRHEGAIQNEDGTVINSSFGSLFGGMELAGRLDLRDAVFQRINAERKVWQQRGELSRVTSETLLDAAGTYIDLLAAAQGEAVIRDTDKAMRELARLARDLAATEPALRVEVMRVQAEEASREQTILKLRAQAVGARAKLAYLLGVGPGCELVPVDPGLAALDLVDASLPVCELVAQALTSGPGVRELEGLLALVQEGMEKSKGPAAYLPELRFCMSEGIFGGGPGSRSDWDNRWDLVVHVRYNLTELVTARDRLRSAQAKINQLHLTYQDLRGKLTAGVQEARETILSGREELRKGQEQINYARETVRLALDRLKTFPEKASPSEVLLAIRSQMGAQLSYLSILRDYDKAQLRLLVLLGRATAPGGGPCGK